MTRNRQDRNQSNVSTPPQEDTRMNPRPEDIAARAYELYAQRGGEHGGDLDDWFTAERELQESMRDGR